MTQQQMRLRFESNDYYAYLNVPFNAPTAEIKKRFRQLALQWHPDKHPGDVRDRATDIFQRLSEAHEILTNLSLRQQYDAVWCRRFRGRQHIPEWAQVPLSNRRGASLERDDCKTSLPLSNRRGASVERDDRRTSLPESLYFPSEQVSSIPAAKPDYIFCPELIVKDPEGKTLKIDGAILPHQQDAVLEVTAEKGLFARVCMFESGQDSGILVESAQSIPLAFMQTGNAVCPEGSAPPAANRHVSISGTGGNDSVDNFVVAQQEGRTFVMRRGLSSGFFLYSIMSAQDGGKVIDSRGRLVASIRRFDRSGLNVWVADGVDAGMMLCAVIADAKLQYTT